MTFRMKVSILLPQVCRPSYFAFLGDRPVVRFALMNLAGLLLQHGQNGNLSPWRGHLCSARGLFGYGGET